MNCSWEQIRREIRAYRSSVNPSNIANIKDFCFDERNNRAYFLATDPSRMKTSTLFMVDLPPLKCKKEKTELANKFRDQSESTFSFTNNQFYAKEFSFTFCSSISHDASESIKPSSLDNFSFIDLSSVNNKTQFKSQQSSALPKIPTVEWKPLLPESCLKEKHFSETLSREEMFVKERRRLALQGITSYQFDSRSGQILFNYGSGIYLGHVSKNVEFYPRPIIPYSSNPVTCSGGIMNFSLAQSPQNNRISPLSSPSINSSSPSSPCCPSLNNTLPPRLDPKLGGRNCDLVAFIRDRDIWVTTLNGLETQLTFCNEHDPDGSSALSCGVAEFVMQEEFHRFTGYYWAPSSASTCMDELVERILYLQISESMVDLVLIPRPGQQGEAEEYRYPKAGTPNAVSDLQIVEFIPRYNEDEEVTTSPVHKRLWGPAALDKLFPWKEYIVRFGWCPNGKSVWVQLLDRLQQRTAIIKIPISNFMSLSEYQKSGGELDNLCASRIEVVFEETSDIWINVDICYFFNDEIISTKNTDTNTSSPCTIRPQLPPTKLIITSESTGFRHLYLVTKPSAESLHYHVRPITAGDWPIVDRPIYVDAKRELVYFTAKKDTPLEAHIYVASCAETADPYSVIRLSELGYSHFVVMDENWQIFPKVSETLGIFVKGGNEEEVRNNEDKRQNERIPIGEFFNFKNSDGVTIYGCLYRPTNYIQGKKYPTLLSIYGGPKSQ
ncbi:9933_t:CDS:2, partial [Cetraspora pellucida]